MRLLCAAIICLTATAQPKQAGGPWMPESKTLQVQGVARTYLLLQPAQRSLAIPIVIVLHGAGGSGKRVGRFARLHTAPFFRTALVVYPDALDQRWNESNDVTFLNALIDDLIRTDKALDRTRVFAIGLNSGGSFAMRLGCQLNSRVAAVASIGGPLPKALQQTCKPNDPLPVLYLHGEYPGDGSAGQVVKPDETFQFWRIRNQCSGEPFAEDRDGETPVKIHIAKKCKDGSEVHWVYAASVQQRWQAATARQIAAFLSRFRRAPRL